MSKIFQIGFNKTATTSLYWLFINSGHSALHSSGRRARKKGHKAVKRIHPQVLIHHNILSGLPPVQGLEDFEAFFDMEYDFPRNPIKLENFKNFSAFAEAYPNAKFILNTRDKDAWLRSRARHQDGDYLGRSMVRLDLDEAQTLQFWADEYDRHHDAVREYFLTQQGRLMEFKLEEAPIDELVAFCRPQFNIDPARWGAARVTDEVASKKGLGRMSLSPADASAVFEQNFAPWVRALDVRFEQVAPGAATLSIPITDQVTRMGDIISGQTLATLADTAMVFACFAHFGKVTPVATTNLDTVFLRPGTGARIRCEASVVRAGKALIFTQARMIAEPSGKDVATATATFYVP